MQRQAGTRSLDAGEPDPNGEALLPADIIGMISGNIETM